MLNSLAALPSELEWVEFKHNFHSKEEIGERISALSNSAALLGKPYGYLIFGIEDGTHNILGTSFHAKTHKVGNEELADVMHRMGFCEEKGSGMDKAVEAIGQYQLPAIKYRVSDIRTTIILSEYKEWSDTTREERVQACYQHACLKYLSNEMMTNKSFRTRMGVNDKNYTAISGVI